MKRWTYIRKRPDMRTYTRKRPDHQVIEDVHSLCRLCLTQAEKPVPIFTQQTDVCALAIRIMICVGLEITNEECFPNIICSNCLEMLEQFYSFRKKCEVSYQKLKSHQAAIKIMNYKEEQKDKEPVKTSSSPTQRLRIEEATNICFKLDSDGIVQICDENSKNSFAKHKLVSIVKIDKPLKQEDHIVCIENDINTEIHAEHSYESQHNSNTSENSIHCNKLIFDNENMEIVQNDKQRESLEQNIILSREGNRKIIGVNNTQVAHTNTIIDNNNKNSTYGNAVNAKDISTVGVNHVFFDPVDIDPTRNATSNIEILDVKHVVVDDNNVVMKTSELADERHQGNLIINEMDTNEVAADGLIDTIDHNQTEPQNSGLPDVLTSVLLDLGVLTRHGDSLIVLDHTRTVALETEDGNQFTLEFVEEPEGQDIEQVTADKNKRNAPVHKNKTKKLSKDLAVILENKAVCNVCGKGFASNSGLKRHTWSVHGKQRPHQCRVCGRAFGQKEVMLRHELVHSERRPFQCASCPKSFTQRQALHAHARSHAPPHARALQLYRCARCPKVFLYPSGLSRHTMTHSGRVFVCGGCQKAFKDKSSLKRHMNNTKHGQMPLAPPRQPPGPGAQAQEST